jgi:predicted acyltransferase
LKSSILPVLLFVLRGLQQGKIQQSVLKVFVAWIIFNKLSKFKLNSLNMGFASTLDNFRIIPEKGSSTGRVLSVDALRGFDMFWIMGGEVIFKSLDNIFHAPATRFISTQLDHVEWLGFRFYDIIMPLFVLLAGVSIPFAFSRRLGRVSSRAELWPHIIKRFLILWVLGMAVQGNLLTYDTHEFKFYSNTLQSIAVGYVIASLFVLYFRVRWQLLGTVLLMLVYWAFLSLVPVPGYGAGEYTPEGNFAIYFDKLILGRFQDGTTYSWIISSLNFGATAMLGVFAGYILKSGFGGMRKVMLLLALGIGMIALARVWDLVHPIVKHIWTGSFVLFSGGLCYLLLAVFYLLVDELKFQGWSRAFVIIGSNSILAYTAWHLFDFGLVSDVFTRGLEPMTGSWYPFIRSVAAFLVIYLILRYLYFRKIFLKV